MCRFCREIPPSWNLLKHCVVAWEFIDNVVTRNCTKYLWSFRELQKYITLHHTSSHCTVRNMVVLLQQLLITTYSEFVPQSALSAKHLLLPSVTLSNKISFTSDRITTAENITRCWTGSKQFVARVFDSHNILSFILPNEILLTGILRWH